MNEEKDIKETTQPNIVVKQDSLYEVIAKLLDKLIDKCITTHFKATLFAVCTTIVISTAIIYDVNFSLSVNLADQFFVNNAFNIIISVLGALFSGLLFFVINKITSIKNSMIESNTNKDKLNDIILDQFNMIRQDFSSFVTVIDSFKNDNNTVNDSVNTLSKLISEDIIDTKRIIHVLASVYNSIKKNPSKNTIIDMLTIRTKLLTVNMIELSNEYFTLLGPKTSNTSGILNLNDQPNSKTQFIKDKLNSMFKDIKNEYITEIYELSKNTIDHSLTDNINQILDKLYDRVIGYMFDNNKATMQEVVFYIIEDVKKITIEIEELFTNNINTESILNTVDDDLDRRD